MEINSDKRAQNLRKRNFFVTDFLALSLSHHIFHFIFRSSRGALASCELSVRAMNAWFLRFFAVKPSCMRMTQLFFLFPSSRPRQPALFRVCWVCELVGNVNELVMLCPCNAESPRVSTRRECLLRWFRQSILIHHSYMYFEVLHGISERRSVHAAKKYRFWLMPRDDRRVSEWRASK